MRTTGMIAALLFLLCTARAEERFVAIALPLGVAYDPASTTGFQAKCYMVPKSLIDAVMQATTAAPQPQTADCVLRSTNVNQIHFYRIDVSKGYLAIPQLANLTIYLDENNEVLRIPTEAHSVEYLKTDAFVKRDTAK